MERIKIAVVGLHFGRVIVEELLKEPGKRFFELIGVCDLNPVQAGLVSTEFNVPIIPSLDAILADPTIGAVALMTPPSGRAALIRRIIQSGRHVMTTKPFERDPALAVAVLDEAFALKKAVHLNSPAVPVSPVIRQIEKWVAEHNLGRPIGVRADLWAHKPKPADGTWYDDPLKCPAAPIYRIGIYVINEVIELFGEVEAVSVVTSRLLTGRPTPDNAQMAMKFKNGALGNVFVSFCIKDGRDHRHMFTLNYERGTIYWDVGSWGADNPACNVALSLVRDSGKRWFPLTETVSIPVEGGYAWEAFYEACRGNDAAGSHYRKRIIWGLKVLDAMARADQSGRLEVV